MERRERISSEDDIPQSPTYSKMLFEIARLNHDGIVVVSSNRSLSNALDRDRSSITRQLKILTEAGYLIAEQQDKYNSIGYTINTRKIIELFTDEYEARLSSDFNDYVQDMLAREKDLVKQAETLRERTVEIERRRQLIAALRQGEPGEPLQAVITKYLAEYAHKDKSGYTLDEVVKALIQYPHGNEYSLYYLDALQQRGNMLNEDGQMLFFFFDLIVRTIPRRPFDILSSAQEYVEETLESVGIDVEELNKRISEHLDVQEKESQELRDKLTKPAKKGKN